MLDTGGAITLLAERGLLDRSEVIDGSLRIVDASRRNRNLHVLRRRGPSYMIKHGLGTQRRRTVAHEAAVYRRLSVVERGALVALLPRVAAYLPEECLLVTELVRGGESLERYHVRRGRFSPRYARRLAKALAAVHRVKLERAEAGGFPHGLPWGLGGLHRPVVTMSGGISNGATLAIRMIQNIEGYSALLDAAAAQWRPTCLIHGDLRFDNCVFPQRPDARGKSGLKFVDWELARWGDPCWDAGAVLAGYLSSWLLSCPISGETPPQAVIHLGRFKFSDMQRSAGAFWAAYRDTMASSDEISLARAIRFAAVHLLESMVEELQTSAVLTGRAVCLAELAHNLLAQPDEAADHFLVTELIHRSTVPPTKRRSARHCRSCASGRRLGSHGAGAERPSCRPAFAPCWNRTLRSGCSGAGCNGPCTPTSTARAPSSGVRFAPKFRRLPPSRLSTPSPERTAAGDAGTADGRSTPPGSLRFAGMASNGGSEARNGGPRRKAWPAKSSFVCPEICPAPSRAITSCWATRRCGRATSSAACACIGMSPPRARSGLSARRLER